MRRTSEPSTLSVLSFVFNGKKEYALVEQKTRKGSSTFYVDLFNIELYILFMAPLILKENQPSVSKNKEAGAIVEAVRRALFAIDTQASGS